MRRRNDITAVVVGDDALARAGLAATLARAGVAVVSEVAGRDFASAATGAARVAVWDVGDGRVRAEALAHETRLPVVALVDEVRHAAAMLGAGARAVLRRDTPAVRVVSACRAVLDGFLVVDAALATALHLPSHADTEAFLDPLTSRETEVLQLLAQGLSNKRIAAVLGISEHTAKFHVNAVLSKLGAAGRTDAVVRAARLGLVVL